MRFHEISEAAVDGKTKQAEIVKRLERAGGDVVQRIRNDAGDEAVVGVNGMAKGKIYFVIYPDGTFDRFEPNNIVIYRTGYTGPRLNDKEYDDYQRQQKRWEDEDRRERDRERREERKEWQARERLNKKRDALRSKWEKVVIPPNLKALCDKADEVFDEVINYIGPDIRSGCASYGDDEANEEAMTQYYDPRVILSLVRDRAHDMMQGQEFSFDTEHDVTPLEWEEFCDLPIKYQLKVASHYAGSMDY